jgi:hypothetical protein
VPPDAGCPTPGPPSPEVTEAFCRVPSTQFSQAPWYALPVHLCRFRVRSDGGLFPGTGGEPPQSDKGRQASRSVTSSWPGNINPVPIDYAFRPRLRGRLTLLRLALSRNPWTSGERVSHPLCRYSCQHSRFRSLHRSLTGRLHSKPRVSEASEDAEETWSCLTERSATACTEVHTLSFGSWLEPRYIFAARQLI